MGNFSTKDNSAAAGFVKRNPSAVDTRMRTDIYGRTMFIEDQSDLPTLLAPYRQVERHSELVKSAYDKQVGPTSATENMKCNKAEKPYASRYANRYGNKRGPKT